MATGASELNKLPAEFNKDHIPAFLAGKEPKVYLSVYPSRRSQRP